MPDGSSVLTMFVCDGAGSALRGGEGARLAVQTAVQFISDQFMQPGFALSEDVAIQCVMSVRDIVYRQAEAESLKPRDFACTFLGVIATNTETLVMQIGDGGIVLDVGRGLEVAVEPMSGEYANMTHFISDEDAVNVVVCKVFAAPATKIAAFSDGIQRLALNMASNTAHDPFFTPFFEVLSKATLEQEDQLQYALTGYLNSSAVNERTDDDKTLALAVRVA